MAVGQPVSMKRDEESKRDSHMCISYKGRGKAVARHPGQWSERLVP